MPIDPDAVGSKSDPVEVSWGSKDALLYAVGTLVVAFGFKKRKTYTIDRKLKKKEGASLAPPPAFLPSFGLLGASFFWQYFFRGLYGGQILAFPEIEPHRDERSP